MKFWHMAIGVLFWALANTSISASTIHLEHSLRFGEGSLWGTEGDLLAYLDYPSTELPTVFRLPWDHQGKFFANVADLPYARGRFIEDEVLLSRQLLLCYDQRLTPLDADFFAALEYFRLKLVGGQMEIRWHIFNPVTIGAACDLLIIQGQWDDYPYRLMARSAHVMGANQKMSWQNQIFAIYLRASKNWTPVVVIPPDVSLRFNQETYLMTQEDQLTMDGRVLLLHEIGHYLGLDHLGNISGGVGKSELTAMGLRYELRDQHSDQIRYTNNIQMWKIWDPYQIDIYRRQWWKFFP